ncbi:MAG: HD domain-containing protein [Bacteroidota bacterium]
MFSINIIKEAWELAAAMHHGQIYFGDGEVPDTGYLNHIGSVTFEVMAAVNKNAGLDAELAVLCAILHDSLEDTGLRYEQIENKFGTAVAAGVLALTKKKEIPVKKERMLDSLNRIKKGPKEIWAVKLADRICNLRKPPQKWSPAKKRAYLEEAKLILEELGAADDYLKERLKQKILAYKNYI